MLYLIAGAVAVYALYALFVGEDSPPSRPRSPTRRNDQQHRQVERPPADSSAALRAKAKQEGELMAQCYEQSKEAYERRDRALAKTLSEQGKRHALKMETLSAQASAIIFKENNQDRPAGEVDLHGLYVKEAISYTEKVLKKARKQGDSELHLIVGQGNHSDGGVSRLRPAIQEAMRIRGLQVEVDPKNPGVLRVVM